MNKPRLLKLAAFLDTLPRRKFDFAMIRDYGDAERAKNEGPTCGAVGCAIGWLPTVFPRLAAPLKGVDTPKGYTFDLQGPDAFHFAAELLDIDFSDCEDLFTPGRGPRIGLAELSYAATPKQVAKQIRQFIEAYPDSTY